MKTSDLTRLGIITSLGLILFVLESLAPRPLPWMKVGLGNSAVLVALILFGPVQAIAVSVVKILAGSLMIGSIGSPAFVIGGGAGMASVSVMALLHRSLPGLFSTVGLSVAGAVVHQFAQLALAFVYIGHGALFSYVPIFAISGLISGTLIGLVVHFCLAQIGKLGWMRNGG
jgi:heptaprenyl diphosphate synthase